MKNPLPSAQSSLLLDSVCSRQPGLSLCVPVLFFGVDVILLGRSPPPGDVAQLVLGAGAAAVELSPSVQCLSFLFNDFNLIFHVRPVWEEVLAAGVVHPQKRQRTIWVTCHIM
jgi:hypothetical protein